MLLTDTYMMHTLNSIHKLALRLLYNDYELPFDRILEKIKQKSVNRNHIESLALIISKLFVVRVNKDNHRNFQALESSDERTVTFGAEIISYRRSQIWNVIPERLRILATLNKFKNETKK